MILVTFLLVVVILIIFLLILKRRVVGSNQHQVTVLIVHRTPLEVLPSGRARILRPGERVVPVSLDWHDLSFGPWTVEFQEGQRWSLTGDLSFRVRRNQILEFLRVIPGGQMPRYPDEKLRDWLLVRWKRALMEAAFTATTVNADFQQRALQLFESALEGTVEARVTFLPSASVPGEPGPEMRKEVEMLRRLSALAQEAKDLTQQVRENIAGLKKQIQGLQGEAKEVEGLRQALEEILQVLQDLLGQQ